MKFLYVSTDAEEAMQLIDPPKTKGYQYSEIDLKDGLELAKRVGFNPMMSVRFDGSIPSKAIEVIAIDLAEKGLFTAIESLGFVKKIFPKDMKIRNHILAMALQEKYHLKKDSLKAYNLFIYSNNPYQIRKH
jgi:hypothetical protein